MALVLVLPLFGLTGGAGLDEVVYFLLHSREIHCFPDPVEGAVGSHVPAGGVCEVHGVVPESVREAHERPRRPRGVIEALVPNEVAFDAQLVEEAGVHFPYPRERLQV